MKLIVLDCLRRWGWLYLLGFIFAIGLNVMASFFSPFGVFTPYFLAPWLGPLFVVAADFMRGASGVTIALPVSVRKVGLSYWIIGVCVPPVILTLALIVAAIVVWPFNPPITFGWDQVGLTFIISLLINGCIFFVLTFFKVGPQEGLWNNVVGGLAGASWGLCAFSGMGVKLLLDSGKATAGTTAGLVCVALVSSVVGLLRSGDTVRVRARNRVARQCAVRKSTRVAENVASPGSWGISGLPYMFLESVRFSLGMAVAFMLCGALLRSFLHINSMFLQYTLLLCALLPSLRYLPGLRQMRALPLSLDGLTVALFLLPLVTFSLSLGMILLVQPLIAPGLLNATPATLLFAVAIASLGNSLVVRFGPKSLPPVFVMSIMLPLVLPMEFFTWIPLAGFCALTVVLMIAAFAILRHSLRSSEIYRLPTASLPVG